MWHFRYRDKTSHTDFVHGVSWNPIDGRLFTCGWDFKVVGRTIPLLGGASGDDATESNGIVPDIIDTSIENHAMSCDETKDKQDKSEVDGMALMCGDK